MHELPELLRADVELPLQQADFRSEKNHLELSLVFSETSQTGLVRREVWPYHSSDQEQHRVLNQGAFQKHHVRLNRSESLSGVMRGRQLYKGSTLPDARNRLRCRNAPLSHRLGRRRRAPPLMERSAGGRIVNGTDALSGQYPYQISLRSNGRHSCGGSIINENFILTAAHCVIGSSASSLSVEAGTTQLGEGVQVPVAAVRYHTGYRPSNYYIHDIAVLKLAAPLPLNDLIQPITLPAQMQDTAAGTPAVLTGWGLPYTGGSVMQRLQTVDILIVSDEECLAIHSSSIPGYTPMYPHPSNICAGVPGGGKGQCNGDSGGPLVANGVQVGVVSWSQKPCTVAPFPGVFTEVSYYIDWIQEQIQD
ncbi:Trypsin-1 [Gryllus bimaculatus]|nr:Trypsin-1 [Gryllus bimaculatus]